MLLMREVNEAREGTDPTFNIFVVLFHLMRMGKEGGGGVLLWQNLLQWNAHV